MPVRPLLPLACAALLLAGCSVRTHDDGKDSSASISIGNASADANSGDTRGISIKAPGFSAKMDLPNLTLGSGSMQIEDMKIFPGTKLQGVNITGDANNGSGEGNVEMGFTAPADAHAVIAWYQDQAQKTGWTSITPASGNQFEATKDKDGHDSSHFALQVASNGSGSQGHFIVTGR